MFETSRFRPYPKYRPVNLQWLDRIPVSWKVVRLDSVFEMVRSTIKQSELRGKTVLHYSIPSVQETGDGRIEDGDVINSDKLLLSGKELLVSKLNPRKATVILSKKSEHPIVASTEFVALLPKNIHPQFGQYLYLSHWIRERISAVVQSATKSHQRANPFDIYKIWAAIPPFEEQIAIVSFLDQQISKLDQLLEKKKRLIELLQEKRQVIITQAVTKGLNPNVPMKDSGIEWLGEVPAHWEVCKLNFRYSIELGKMLDEKRIRGKSLVRYLRNQDVQWGYINTEDLPEMDIEISERDRYTVKNGDLLVCEGGDIGRAAIWRGNDNEIGYQKALHRVRPRVNERDTPEFFYFVLVAAKHRGVFNETDNKATIPHLTGEKFRQYRFAFPPIEEQREIVDYLAHIESQYRILKSKLERSTILLDQYRQALITAAVTGQIDVREKMTVSAETISAGKE